MNRDTKDNLVAAALMLVVIATAVFTPPQYLRMSLGFTAALMTCLFIIAFTVARNSSERVTKMMNALEDDPYATEMATGARCLEPLAEKIRHAYGQSVKKKHPQFILAMHASFFDGCPYFPAEINPLFMNSFLEWPETQSALIIKERDALEKDGDYRQLLPYMVVRQVSADGSTRVLAYQRGSGVGESRLVGKTSVGFGGHVDLEDVQSDDSTINLRATLIQAAHREKYEELQRPVGEAWLDTRLSSGDLFITHNEGVQRMHLGVVMFLDVPATRWDDLRCRERELHTIGFRTPHELLAAHHNGEVDLEVWSRLVLKHMHWAELEEDAEAGDDQRFAAVMPE